MVTISIVPYRVEKWAVAGLQTGKSWVNFFLVKNGSYYSIFCMLIKMFQQRGKNEDSEVRSGNLSSKNFYEDEGDRIYQEKEEWALQKSMEYVTGGGGQNVWAQVQGPDISRDIGKISVEDRYLRQDLNNSTPQHSSGPCVQLHATTKIVLFPFIHSANTHGGLTIWVSSTVVYYDWLDFPAEPFFPPPLLMSYHTH